MKKILVTYATQEEFVSINLPNADTGYLRTGIGKMKSAYYVSQAIDNLHPDLIINVGTAGTIRHQVGDIFVCRHFIDRDMKKLKDYGVAYEVELPYPDSFDLPSSFAAHEGVCNTGDTFLTEHDEVDGDIIDMESYAQAFVCQAKEVPFIAVKYVTDVIGQNSVEVWQARLKDAVQALTAFFKD